MNKLIQLALVSCLALVMIAPLGCGKVVPPGNTVIILTPSGGATIKNEGVYKAWGRDKLYFVDTKLKSYSKDIQILCADDINMDVSIKWIGSFNVTTDTIDVIKKKVPATKVTQGEISGYELSLDAFYATAMEDVLSSLARGIVSVYKTDNIREHREEIRQAIKTQFLARLKELNYPVETADVLVSNLDYPVAITEKRNRIKDAELQDLENAAIAKAEVSKARRNAELEMERGKANLVKAEADAAANKVRASSLTPEILAVKQLEVLVRLAEGPNNTVVVIPFESIRPELTTTLLTREATERVRDALAQKTE